MIPDHFNDMEPINIRQSHPTVPLSWVAALLQPVGDKCPALVVQPHDALLLLLAQPQLEDLPAVRVDRVLHAYDGMNFHVRALTTE